MASTDLKRTPLHHLHEELGARMLPFAGFDMPVQYTGIIEEHMMVRQHAGLFDVSHMGEFMVEGPDAFAAVQHLVTNDLGRLVDGQAMYTVMCRPGGGCIDDLLVYRLNQERFMLVVNASNIEKDFEWVVEHCAGSVDVIDRSGDTALLAFQGPQSIALFERLTGVKASELEYYHFRECQAGELLGAEHAIVSRTGYTGEPGLEIYCPNDVAEPLWHLLLQEGIDSAPVGLGARDTLRLESGFALYGHELTESINPIEAGLGWVVKFKSGDFIGREALLEAREKVPSRKLVAFVLRERGIPRQGYEIFDEAGDQVGEVTSGSQSPILKRGIGMGYVRNSADLTSVGSGLWIGVRNKRLHAEVVKPPLHRWKDSAAE